MYRLIGKPPARPAHRGAAALGPVTVSGAVSSEVTDTNGAAGLQEQLRVRSV